MTTNLHTKNNASALFLLSPQELVCCETKLKVRRTAKGKGGRMWGRERMEGGKSAIIKIFVCDCLKFTIVSKCMPPPPPPPLHSLNNQIESKYVQNSSLVLELHWISWMEKLFNWIQPCHTSFLQISSWRFGKCIVKLIKLSIFQILYVLFFPGSYFLLWKGALN